MLADVEDQGALPMRSSRSRRPVRPGVLGAVGNTPLVRLERAMPPDVDFRLFAKLEGLNPGGSIKDRPAIEILEAALRSGDIGLETVVIESSSGNMGIGLAQACRYHKLRLICVVDPKTSEQNLRILRAYGAEIDHVAVPDPETGEFLQARLARVRKLLREVEGSFWPNQYANRHNPYAHYRGTMEELVSGLDGKLDYLFAATSTCGTICGCGQYVRDHGLPTRVVAVDAVGSLIFGGEQGQRLIPGMGASLRPEVCDPAVIHEVVQVSDLECVLGCRRLMAREAILAGGSAGGVIAAVERLRHRIAPGSNCVAILADRGERYLNTIFDDDWVRQHFGESVDLLSEELAGAAGPATRAMGTEVPSP